MILWREKKANHTDYLKHQEFIRAGYIKDWYPQVKTLTFELNYRDPDGLAQPSSETYTRGPEHSAFLKIQCPYRECINGGYDLTELISDMLNNNKLECHGKVSCQGWQDRNRIGKYRCLCELTYKITATYF